MLDSLNKNEVKEFFLKGKRIKAGKFVFLTHDNDNKNDKLKFAIVISGKSKANKRNKIRRRLREIIRKNNNGFKKYFIVIVKKEIFDLPFLLLREDFLKSLKGTNLI